MFISIGNRFQDNFSSNLKVEVRPYLDYQKGNDNLKFSWLNRMVEESSFEIQRPYNGKHYRIGAKAGQFKICTPNKLLSLASARSYMVS